MKSVLLLAVLLGSQFPVWVSADEESAAQAEILLEVMNMESVLEQSIEQMLDLQIQQNPAIGQFREIMLSFLAKHMSYESMKPDMVKMYADSFTADELRDMIAFNQTATGQKALRLLPSLMQEGAALGATRVQENLGELQQMIEEAAAETQ
ncbi:MAG: DUF2059 domain-containing protein [Gammaproteobacteria bacterium]|nr:DUF2059 domain-containing protein [Gammaproteobacteria bacterium]